MFGRLSLITNVSNILFSFTFWSILGWTLKVVYRSIRERRPLNPGLLKGPYLPLYGTAALILIGCIHLIHKHNIFIKFLSYFLITTGLELIAGFNAQYFFNLRLLAKAGFQPPT